MAWGGLTRNMNITDLANETDAVLPAHHIITYQYECRGSSIDVSFYLSLSNWLIALGGSAKHA